MFRWWRELLEIRYEFRERNARLHEEVCQSCEILKQTNDHLRMDNEKLLRRLIDKPEPELVRNEVSEPQPLTRHIPWAVRKQMLEAEDRQKAKLMAQFGALGNSKIEDLEKEMGIAAEAREEKRERQTEG